ncbi:uncharacterized protein LOC141708789 isoform X1 [Apium graveolens]|uniref:uncharacterized protein LOC141708789 isoform X1 n=1 Tax=Apium graveolens TaxID=4045 RepID=UPI003D7B8AF6
MVVVSIVSPLQPINGSLSSLHSLPSFKWGSITRRKIGERLIFRRAKGPSFRVLANPNASTGKENSKEVIMVDPVEAKRLAAKQMEKIKAKEKFKEHTNVSSQPHRSSNTSVYNQTATARLLSYILIKWCAVCLSQFLHNLEMTLLVQRDILHLCLHHACTYIIFRHV